MNAKARGLPTLLSQALLALVFFAVPAAAQMPPPLPPPPAPTFNPSSPYVVPQAPEVPVSPAAPRSSPDFPGVARVPNDASVFGSDTIMAPEPRGHFASAHRARLYMRYGKRHHHAHADR